MMFRSLLTGFRQQARLQAEIIALRHQLTVLQRTPYPKRLLLNQTDRWFWVWLSRLWSGFCSCAGRGFTAQGCRAIAVIGKSHACRWRIAEITRRRAFDEVRDSAAATGMNQKLNGV